MSYLMKSRLSSFFAIYNNCGATPATREARKVLFYKTFRASFTLTASLYVCTQYDRPSGGTRCTRSPGTVLAGMPFMVAVDTINHHLEIIIENLLRSGADTHIEHNSAKFLKIILYGREKALI